MCRSFTFCRWSTSTVGNKILLCPMEMEFEYRRLIQSHRPIICFLWANKSGYQFHADSLLPETPSPFYRFLTTWWYPMVSMVLDRWTIHWPIFRNIWPKKIHETLSIFLACHYLMDGHDSHEPQVALCNCHVSDELYRFPISNCLNQMNLNSLICVMWPCYGPCCE